MRDIKEVEGLTYSAISKRTQEIGIPIPAKTIERKLAPGGDSQDIMRETARAIEIAILGSAPYPCYLAFVEAQSGQANADGKDNTGEVQRLLHELEAVRTSYKEELESVRASYKAELETVRMEAQKKIEYLRAENEKKERTIERLENRIDKILDK